MFRTSLRTLGGLAFCVVYSLTMLSLQLSAQERELRLSIVDNATKQPIPARVYLKSSEGKWYYFSSSDTNGSAVKYEKQNWLNKNSVEYHTTVSAGVCTTKVPTGRYWLSVEHGKSYRTVSQDLLIADKDVELTVPMQRWSDPASKQWYSGDTHIHRTIEDLRNVVLAEDLNVAFPLSYWVTHSDIAPENGDKNVQDVMQTSMVKVDDSHVIWPRNTEYEIFTVGKKQHTLGALFVLGHRNGLQKTVPPWKPVIDELTKSEPSVLFDMDKLDWPFAMLLPSLAPNALYELSNNHTWRTEFAFRDWNSPTPAYLQPPFGDKSGGHREWLDYTHGMYHTLLNCGLRMAPSAGTANGVHPVPAGFGRVYVHLPEGFEIGAWMREVKRGRSFVTTGPMLYATADGKDPGEVFMFPSAAPTKIQLEMDVESEEPLLYGEVLINGRPEHLLYAANQRDKNGAYRTKLSLPVAPTRSGWFAIRFWERRKDGQLRFAHTAPWYVEVDSKPVGISREEKEYLIQRMQNEIGRSNGIVNTEGMEEYRLGLKFFEQLPLLDDSLEVAKNARVVEPTDELNRWLDNMIIDHQFSAIEVRNATGLDLSRAQSEVDKRNAAISGERLAPAKAVVKLLPYPCGRHPRRGFLDGAIAPQRETKISVFPPWTNGGYVVVDVPEAVFSNLGLTYLAHEHIPTIWDNQNVALPRLEWSSEEDGLSVRRTLPNGIVIASKAQKTADGVKVKIELINGTDTKLTGLRVQVCTMLKGLIGFNQQEPLETVVRKPYIAVRGAGGNRWLVTSWTPCQRVWANPPVPCIHSDPIFPDCEPGETVTVDGELRFYEGPNVLSLMP